MNRVRTLRGRLDDQGVAHRIIVDDGRTNHGYKVVDFRIWPDGLGTDGVYAVLGLSYDMETRGNATDNRQIAWAASAWSTNSSHPASQTFSIVDPDHVIIQDLYIARTNPVDAANYMIVVEPIVLSDDEAILSLIKERSQDDIR